MAPGGSGPMVARAMVARRERALQLQTGPSLTKAIEERETRVRDYALRIREAANRLAGTKQIEQAITSIPLETELVVTIQRANNLPNRASVRTKKVRVDRSRIDEPVEEFESVGKGVACFVEVVFRGIRQRTSTTTVTETPIFNEQITMAAFSPDQDEPSPSAVFENNDYITINVFDEIVTDNRELRSGLKKDDGGISDPVRYPERERRYLGCLHIPLSAVYQMQVLEGTFRLESPPVLLGYVQESPRPACISLYMSLRPQLAPPQSTMEDIISGELPFLSMISYLEDSSLLKIARFVSMIPYLEDSSLLKRRNDIWTSTADFLHLSAGDSEEHAHLLVGYFLEIGQEAFVVLGASTVGARSAFVLTTGRAAQEPGLPPQLAQERDFNFDEYQLRLWNPLSGGCSSVKDATGDLREVGMVYDHTNMWANFQMTGQPWCLKWNFGDGGQWNGFFGKFFPERELATLQLPPFYEDKEDRFYEELETRVEESARGIGAFITKPDNKVSRVLRSLLVKTPAAMEAISSASLAANLVLAQLAPQGGALAPEETNEVAARLDARHRAIATLQTEHNQRVREDARADMVNGHIIALPFSDRYIDAVHEAVLNTGIHRIADERVKYSMAAHVEKGGHSFVCALWIYVAAVRDSARSGY
eukprot:gene15518-21607_t